MNYVIYCIRNYLINISYQYYLINIIITAVITSVNPCAIIPLGFSENYICFKNVINSAEPATQNKLGMTTDLPTRQVGVLYDVSDAEKIGSNASIPGDTKKSISSHCHVCTHFGKMDV